MTEIDKEIYDVINEINIIDDPSVRKISLPDDALIDRYEVAAGLSFPSDYRVFLKSVSNAFVGDLSPLTLNDEMGGVYGELLSAITEGRSLGLPHDWIPICEDNGDYYCLAPDASVRFWSHNGPSDETWPNLTSWMKEVWLAGK